MKLLDIFLICIYLHFCAMKEKGRQVVPWFQTAIAITLFGSIAGTFCIKLLLGDMLQRNNLSETAFITGFTIISVVLFFGIKKYLFTAGRHLSLSQEFLNTYNYKRQHLYKILSIGLVLAMPVILGFLVWLTAKPL